ncbi:hypothetical protein BDW62DRAFT_151428 [Aspergillus aurantiobrunneus]
METLPRGLVSINSGKVSAELGGIDAVDIGDIVQLWKAYSANPSAHEGNAGYRLQNFFWRIWSSKHLTSSLTGSTLARLFLQISEPTTMDSLWSAQESGLSSPGLKPDEKLHPPPLPGNPSSGGSPNTTTKPPLPPILKKSNSSSHGETQKTTRLLLTGLGGQSVTRKPSNPPTPIPSSRPVVIGEQQQQQQQGSSRPSQKKTFTVASKKGSKRRPVLIRRKSSQQSSVSSTRAHSPQPVLSPPANKTSTVPDVLETEIDEEAVENSPDNTKPMITTPNLPTAANPTADPITDPTNPEAEETPKLPQTLLSDLKTLLHKSTPLPPLRPRSSPPLVGFFSATACRHYDVRHLSDENYEQPNTSTLVERDFRTRFAEQKRLAEEYYQQYMNQYYDQGQDQSQGPDQMASSSVEGANANVDPVLAPEFCPGTEETVSPSKSRFGDSQSQSHGASTIATSIPTTTGSGSFGADADVDVDVNPHMFSPVMDTEPLPSSSTSAAPVPVPVPVPVPGPGTGGNPFFVQTPSGLSVPRGPSGLSLLIGQSRNSMNKEERPGPRPGTGTESGPLNTEGSSDE